MDCGSLYRLLDSSKQQLLPSDPEAKRLFHATQTKVEHLSLALEPRV
jgi:hypothetical protein